MQNLQKSDAKMEELLARLAEFDIAMFTTVSPEGQIHSRPMQTQEREPDADVWFVTSLDTEKIAELKQNPNIGIIYHRDADHAYISLAGKARIETDKALIKSKWKEDWRAWFPDGPDQADIAMVKVDVVSAEWWFPEGGRLTVMWEAAKAYVTGTEPDINPPKRVEA